MTGDGYDRIFVAIEASNRSVCAKRSIFERLSLDARCDTHCDGLAEVVLFYQLGLTRWSLRPGINENFLQGRNRS